MKRVASRAPYVAQDGLTASERRMKRVLEDTQTMLKHVSVKRKRVYDNSERTLQQAIGWNKRDWNGNFKNPARRDAENAVTAQKRNRDGKFVRKVADATSYFESRLTQLNQLSRSYDDLERRWGAFDTSNKQVKSWGEEVLPPVQPAEPVEPTEQSIVSSSSSSDEMSSSGEGTSTRDEEMLTGVGVDKISLHF